MKENSSKKFVEEAGPTKNSSNRPGIEWDKILSTRIENREAEPRSDSEKAAKALIGAVERTKFDGKRIKMIHSHFPLYGFMLEKEKKNPFLWQGEADAIGWYDGKYVIVDWKVLELQSYWNDNKDTFGTHLHQCLVYARLLQCHMELDYLPYILIVPIDGFTGRDVYPGLFTDYPKECKHLMESFKWSVEKPDTSLMINLNAGNENIFKEQPQLDCIDAKKDKKLSDLFKEGTTMKDVIKLFDIPPYKFKKEE